MTLTAVVDFTDHSVLFREIHALVAGDLYNPLVLDFSRLPKATVDAINTSNLTLVLKRSQTGATVASVPQFSLVPNHWALRSASLALTTQAVKDWFSALAQSGDVTVDTNGWLEVTDGTTTFVACPVPVVLRDITVRGDISGYYTAAQVDALLADKQDDLTFDNSPSAGSTNPVTSGGILIALNGKADAAATTAAIALKANSADVTTALAGKIGSAELASALASYATTANVNAALALKADSATVNSALALKVSSSDLTAALSSYATTASVTASIASATANLATTSALNAAVSGLATTAALTSGLASKADAATMTSALALKADASAIANMVTSTSLATTLTGYATTASVTTALAPYATTASVTSALALKADASDLALKANQATTYTKTEVDALLAASSGNIEFLSDAGVAVAVGSTSYGTVRLVRGTSSGHELVVFEGAAGTPFAGTHFLSASGSWTSTLSSGGTVTLAPATDTFSFTSSGTTVTVAVELPDSLGTAISRVGDVSPVSGHNDRIVSSGGVYSFVNTALAPYATTASVTSALALKADAAAMTSALALKANQATTYTKTEVDALVAGGGGGTGGQPDVRFLDPTGTALVSGTTELARLRSVSRSGTSVSRIVITGTAVPYAGTHVLTSDNSWTSSTAGGGTVTFDVINSKFSFTYDGTTTQVQITLPTTLGAPLSQLADVTPTDGNDDRAVSSGGTYDFVAAQVATRVSTTLHNEDLVATRLLTAQNATSAAAATRGTTNNLNLLLAFESGVYTKAQTDLLLAGKLTAFTVTSPLQLVNNVLSFQSGSFQSPLLVGGTMVTAVDTTATASSNNLITSGAVASAVAGVSVPVTGVQLNGTDLVPASGKVNVQAVSGVTVNGTAATVTNGVAAVSAVTGVTVNGTAATVTNGVAAVTALTGVTVNGTPATVTNGVAAIATTSGGDWDMASLSSSDTIIKLNAVNVIDAMQMGSPYLTIPIHPTGSGTKSRTFAMCLKNFNAAGSQIMQIHDSYTYVEAVSTTHNTWTEDSMSGFVNSKIATVESDFLVVRFYEVTPGVFATMDIF